MRKALVALLLLGGTAVFGSNTASAVDLSDDAVKGERLATPNFQSEVGRRPGLRTSAGTSDTVYVGYVPGNSGPFNFWSVGAKPGLTAGDACKGCGGQGNEVQGSNGNAGSGNAQWGWEGFEAAWGPQDSLQGWHATRTAYISTGGQTRADWARPWYAIDVGNQISHFPGGHEGRTYGVVGAWHRDDGGPAVGATLPTGATHRFGDGGAAGADGGNHGNTLLPAGANPLWPVLNDTYSAWMGLRAHNDVRFVDGADPDGAGPRQSGALGGTGNPFNVLANQWHQYGPSLDPDGTDMAYPGYSSQMDQMLYRDINMSSNPSANLTITFRYQVQMSTGFGTADGTRTGWFRYDPLQITHTSTSSGNLAVGNFISSTDAGNASAPRDSFMVYVGAPTGATFKTSRYINDPVAANEFVTDPQRKWFSEVVQAVVAGATAADRRNGHFEQILSVSGPTIAATTHSYTVTNGGGTKLAAILANGNNKVRLVFRVKTNRGFDDDFYVSYTSGKRGAVQIDNVTYAFGATTSPAGWGTFENGADPINNSPGVDPLDAWKSTGKPPWATGHVEDYLALGLNYLDLCGDQGDITRICDLVDNILTFGDHENAGHPHGSLVAGTADREFHQSATSPSILLATPADSDGDDTNFNSAPASKNAIGLDADAANATEDLYVDMDIYGGVFDPSTQGDYWRYAFQNYPAADAYGNAQWSGINPPPYIIFNPDPQCFRDFIDHPVKAWGLMQTSNASGLPDSVRIVAQLWQRCFRDAAPQCGSNRGAFYDNISLMLVDGTPQLISVDIWDFFNDTFPSNETVGFDKASFDTTSAVVKIGRAIGGDYVTGRRYATPGDSVLIHSSSENTEMHMIFRILPGPGNYVTNGRPDLDGQFNLRQVPTSATAIVAGSTTNFWSNYIAANGIHGTPAGHPGATPRAGVLGAWDPNVWNSARCDTAEANLFALRQLNVTGGPPIASDFMSTYHDQDPKGGADLNGNGSQTDHGPLATSKNICFVAKLAGPVVQVTCKTGDPGADYTYPPDWAPFIPGTGYPGTARTWEYTKIIPDGLLTPGSHVQYFFARYTIGAPAGAAPLAMVPDTTQVFPQNAESSTDGHRWQQFSVLPDAWKADTHKHPLYNLFGAGLNCMLVVDQNDRRGNERVWVSVADSIGATAAAKRGAHNGWSAAGGADLNDPAGFVAEHGGQPGTTWDLYGVKASESLGTGAGFIGGRVGVRHPANTQIFSSGTGFPGYATRQGPTPGMLNAFYKIVFHMTGDLNLDVLSPQGQRTQNDLALIIDFLNAGDVETPNRGYYAVGDGYVEDSIFSGGAHASLMLNFFGADLEDPNYISLAANSDPVVDFVTAAGVIDDVSHTHGMRNICIWTNDVLAQAGATTAIASEYEDVGGGPYPSGLRHAHEAGAPYISLIDGFDIEHVTGIEDISTGGRLQYYFAVLSYVFDDICAVYGTPIGPLDVHSRDFGNYVRLANNPVRNGEARIDLSLAKSDRVEVKIFDVGGRLVRTLADRMFEAGEHSLRWDGSDNDGRLVARGVYFTQVKYKNSAFSAAKKVTILQ